MRLRRPIAFILSAAVAASALTGCNSFSGHAAAAANSAQVQQLIEFIADLGLERDLQQALQKGGDLRQALLTLLGLENAVNFNVDDLAGARPGQHAVQVWEVTAQNAEDAAALAASQIRAVLEQLKSSGVTEGRIGMVEVDGKYYVVVDVEVTEENTFEPAKPVSDDDDNEDTPSVSVKGVKTADGKTFDVSKLSGTIKAQDVLDIINVGLSGEEKYNASSIIELDLSNCTGLTSIDNSAFSSCDSLTSIGLPEGLTAIGQSAFKGCEQLTSIDLHNTQVKTIGHGAFSECTSLGTVLLPESLESIGNSAFYNCSGLTSIDLRNTKVTTISIGAFDRCTSLGTVLLPESLENIGNSAFYNCTSLTSIDLSNTKVTTIGDGAFSGCTSLGTVLLPASLESIGSTAFIRCTALTSVKLPENLKSIGYRAFDSSGLTSIDLSNTKVTTIPFGTFAFCHGLTEVELPKSLKTIEGDDGSTFTYGAFERCDNLTNIYFYGTDVPTIGTYTFADVIYEGRKTPLTIHCPSSCNIDELKNQLKNGGLTEDDFSKNRVVFEKDPTLDPLTYLFGF